MEWFFSLALLPLLLCGAMCAGGAVLAFVGIKRTRRPSCHTTDDPQRDPATPPVRT